MYTTQEALDYAAEIAYPCSSSAKAVKALEAEVYRLREILTKQSIESIKNLQNKMSYTEDCG